MGAHDAFCLEEDSSGATESEVKALGCLLLNLALRNNDSLEPTTLTRQEDLNLMTFWKLNESRTIKGYDNEPDKIESYQFFGVFFKLKSKKFERGIHFV